MLKFGIVFILFFNSFVSISQLNLDTYSFRELLDSAYVLETTDQDSSKLLYRYMIERSAKEDSFWIKAKSENYLGFILMLEGEFEQSKSLLESANNYFKLVEDSTGITSTFNGIGNIEYYKGKHFEAIQYYQEALKSAQKHDKISSLKNNIAGMFNVLETPAKAVEILQTVIEEKHLIENRGILGDSYNNLANSYQVLDSFALASHYFKEAWGIYNEVGDTYYSAVAGLNIISTMYEAGDYNVSEAHEILSGCRLKLDSIDAPRVEIMFNKMKCVHEYKKQNYNGALVLCDEALNAISTFNEPNEEAAVYSVMVNIFEEKNDYRNAFVYARKLKELRDSLIHHKNYDKIIELQEKWQSAQKDAQISAQNVKISKHISNRNYLIGGFSSLTILAFLLWNRLKLKTSLQKNQLELQQKEIDSLEQKQQLIAMDYMVQGQEEERKRIAKDLHDGLGGLLTSAKLQLKSVEREIEKLEGLRLFEKAETLLENASQEVRRIAHNMMPDALMNLGLQSAVEDLVQHVNLTEELSVKTQFYLSGLILPEKTEVMTYRIIQEILANSVKHAQASEIMIQLTASESRFHLTVEDNGIGFDQAEEKITKSMGIQNIKSRIKYLNGELNLNSAPGKGTSYDIVFPLA